MNGMKKSAQRRSSLGLLSACCTILAATASSGCSQTVIVTADELCRDWRHMTISKHDRLTQGTAEQIESNNLSRPAWGCERGQNKAKT